MAEGISIILPCRNAPEILLTTLTFFWAYGFGDHVAAVILLDNCSTADGMGQVLALAQRQPRHWLIRHERNLGVWASINRGLALSRTRLVMVLTSDVLLGPGVMKGLLQVQVGTGIACLGPDWRHGMAGLPELAWSDGMALDQGTYNGSCWLLDWGRLREEIGWYDPRFYICFGDVDYVERLRQRAAERRDTTLLPSVVRGLMTVHLDKQVRRHDHTAERDTEVELEDGRRFREKWRDAPEVVAAHRALPKEAYLKFKAKEYGGWKEAIPQ